MENVERYVRRIRNERKQRYARAYLGFLRNGGAWPERPVGLSLMAAQAVEMELRAAGGNDRVAARS